jgi:hypothetical protein
LTRAALPAFVVLALVAWPTYGVAFDVRESPEGVTLLTATYQAHFARKGAALTVRRGGETVLEGWAASGPGGVFEKGGAPQAIGTLLGVAGEGDVLVLDYATSVKDSVARLELRPSDDAIRVTARLLVSEADMTPAFAWKLDTSGFWYGGGFQGFRDPQVWPLNEASMVRPAFLVSGVSQATPFWYTTKGVGLWVRTPLDFRLSVNEPVDGVKDGLLRVSMPLASALEYELIVAADLREVVRLGREQGRGEPGQGPRFRKGDPGP